jgi:hypothetical protein
VRAALLLSLLVVLPSLAACAGEIAPEVAREPASQQAASADPPVDPEPAPAAPAVTAVTGGGDSTTSAVATPRYPAPTWGSTNGCYLDPGPEAPGECTVGTERTCPDTIERGTSSGGPSGCRQKCVNVSGTARWSQPTKDTMYCPYNDTNLFIGAREPKCQCNTPLVLSFEDAPIVFDTTAAGAFDLTRSGVCHGSDWPSAASPWLALDRDGSGTIDDGGELFGSATRLASGGFARNGFDALRDLDDNADGVFESADAAFARVVVWTDRNGDRRSTAGELSSLVDAGVRSIDLHDRREVRCDARGNCEGERSRFTMSDGRRGAVVDVYLPTR